MASKLAPTLDNIENIRNVKSGNSLEYQKEYVDALTQKFNKILASQLHGSKLALMQSVEGFHWFYRYGTKDLYNRQSLEELDGLAKIDDETGCLQVVDYFSKLYLNVLENITFEISTSDETKCAEQRTTVLTETHDLSASWEGVYGTITTDQLHEVNDTNDDPVQFIYKRAAGWGDKYSNAPPEAKPIVSNLQRFKNKAHFCDQIYTLQSHGIDWLEAAKSNTIPSDKNGGLKTYDVNNVYALAYKGLPTTKYIQDSLKTGGSASIDLDISNFSSTDCKLNVSGSVGFSVPIEDVLTVSFDGSAAFDLSKYHSSDLKLTIHTEYEGITFIGTSPWELSTNLLTGWYDNQILQQIIKNDGIEDVTGLKLSLGQYKVNELFGPGKDFARIKTLVISQPPTITLTFYSSQLDEVKSHFKVNAKVKINILGFDIASVSGSYEVTKIDTSRVAEGITITLTPPKQSPSTAPQDMVADIIGGVISYPPNNI